MEKIKVLLADDHQLILESLSHSLNEHPDIEVVASAQNGLEVLTCLKQSEVDVAILDLNMPQMNGMECLEIINEEHPNLKVIFLTIYQEEYVIRRLISTGAKAFMLKNTSVEKLIEVIHLVYNGQEYFHDLPDTYGKLENTSPSAHDTLTVREKEIIRLVVQGLSGHEIAEKLFISEYTANTHRKNILRKLGLSNIAQLVAFAKSSGILD